MRNLSRIDILVPNTDECTVYTNPEIYMYPDPETRILSLEVLYFIMYRCFATMRDFRN